MGAARTPVGNFNGGLASVSAAELGSVALREALARGSVKANQVDEVFMGQVLTAGVPIVNATTSNPYNYLVQVVARTQLGRQL